MADATAELEILVQIKAAIENLDKLKTEAKKTSDEAGKSFGTLKNAFSTALGVIGAASVQQVFGKLAGFISGSVSAAAEQEKAFASLRKSMELTGEASDAALGQMKSFVDLLERETLFPDEEIVNGLKLAKSFGTTNEEARDLVKAAADLAAATGKDLNTAIEILGKSLTGVLGPLDNLIPETKNLTKAQLAAGDAIKITSERYGGSAAADLDTYAGSVNTLSDAWGNFEKSVGRSVTESEILKDALNLLAEAIDKITPKEIDDTTRALQLAKDKAIEAARETNRLFQAGGGDAESAEGNKLRDRIRELYALPLESFKAQVPTHLAEIRKFDDERVAAEKKTQDRIAAVKKEEADKATEKAAAAAKREVEAREKSEEEYYLWKGEQERALFNSLKEISQKDLDVIADIAKKEVEEVRKAIALLDSETEKFLAKSRSDVEEVAKNPIAFVITANKDAIQGFFRDTLGKDFALSSETERQIAGGIAGGIDAALNGKEGAKTLISGAAGAFADALIPGLGPAITSIVSKLSEGPEATKAFIREFIDAIPDIMIAVGEAMPAVVEAFVDSLVNEGGAARIAVAITKAMLGEGLAKSIGKQIGLEFGSAFNSSNIAQTLRGAFDYGRQQLAQFPAALNAAITRFQNAGKEIGTTLSNAIKDLPANIKLAFTEATTNLSANISSGITTAITGIGAAISEGFKNLALPTIPTPGWLQSFIDAANKISGGAGSGSNPVEQAREEVEGLFALTGDTGGSGGVAVAGGQLDTVIALLVEIGTILRQGQTVETSVQFNSKTLADIMLTLSRRGARTAA